ncbi:MAG: chromate transporter [Clostridiales bacterium]|jgi:chromate transporter|nr:chromate transporter [Clostridiales bacterium]
MSALVVLFLIFFRIGLIGFGGGYAIISIIASELGSLGISSQQFADLVAIDLVVPGPLAVNGATYVGYLSSGFWGALAATLGISLPSYAVVLSVMYFVDKFRQSRFVQGFLAGVRPAAIGLIAAASMTIGKDVFLVEGTTFGSFFGSLLGDPLSVRSPVCLIIFILATVALAKLKANPILVTVLAGAAGALLLP